VKLPRLSRSDHKPCYLYIQTAVGLLGTQFWVRSSLSSVVLMAFRPVARFMVRVERRRRTGVGEDDGAMRSGLTQERCQGHLHSKVNTWYGTALETKDGEIRHLGARRWTPRLADCLGCALFYLGKIGSLKRAVEGLAVGFWEHASSSPQPPRH
jgi:hypothetical protein